MVNPWGTQKKMKKNTPSEMVNNIMPYWIILHKGHGKACKREAKYSRLPNSYIPITCHTVTRSDFFLDLTKRFKAILQWKWHSKWYEQISKRLQGLQDRFGHYLDNFQNISFLTATVMNLAQGQKIIKKKPSLFDFLAKIKTDHDKFWHGPRRIQSCCS